MPVHGCRTRWRLLLKTHLFHWDCFVFRCRCIFLLTYLLFIHSQITVIAVLVHAHRETTLYVHDIHVVTPPGSHYASSESVPLSNSRQNCVNRYVKQKLVPVKFNASIRATFQSRRSLADLGEWQMGHAPKVPDVAPFLCMLTVQKEIM